MPDLKAILSYRILFLLILCFSLSQSLLAQCTNGTQPECACETAPVLCSIDELDGYTFSMTAFQHPQDGPTPICPGANDSQSNNPTWFAFTAWCTNLRLRVTPNQCHSVQGYIGFQLAIYDNCNFTHAVACNADPQDCTTNSKILNINGLQIGRVYYFLVDGCFGSYCDVTIDILGVCGTEEIAPWTQPVSGEKNPCTGDAELYAVEQLDGARFYHWFIDGVATSVTSTNNFTQTWNTPGTYQLCVDVSNDPCVPITSLPLQQCITVEVHEANAGTLSIPNPNPCTGEIIDIASTGFTLGPDNTQVLLVTDALGNIVEVISGAAGTFRSFNSGMFTVYAYNYLTSTGTFPMVGMNINAINCVTACCDLESQAIAYHTIQAVVSQIICNDNETGMDSTDDTFTFDVLVTGQSAGTHWRSSDGTLDGIFGTIQHCGPFPISVGGLNFDLHDYDIPTCSTSIFVEAPHGCSSCPQIIDAGTGSLLDCNTTVATLTGTTSESGAYAWSGPNLFTANTLITTVKDSGWYYLSCIFPKQCTFLDSVYMDQNVDYPVASAGPDQTLDCTHAEVYLDGSGSLGNNLDFAWLDLNGLMLSSQPGILLSLPGIYTLQLTNSVNGCVVLDSAEVLLNPNNIEIIDANVIDENCFEYSNGSIDVSAIGGGAPPFTYTLDGTLTNSTGQFSELAPGAYDIQITDANGCSLDTVFIITQGILLGITLPEVIEVVSDETGRINASVNVPENDLNSVEWTPPGIVSCDTCLQTTIHSLENQTLILTVIHENGCVATAELNVIIVPKAHIYIPNVFSPDGDGINDYFTVYTNERVLEVETMDIFDRWGDQIYHGQKLNPNIPGVGWDGKFKGQKVQSGVFAYAFKLLMADGTSQKVTGNVTVAK